MNRRRRQLGFTAITTLYVVTVLALAAGALSGLTGGSMIRARREVPVNQAFQLAQAGIEFEYQHLINALEDTHGVFPAYYRSFDEIPVTKPAGTEGLVLVEPVGNGRSAWITSEVYVNGIGRSVRVLLRARDVGIWNNAIFAGTGASGQVINGNVDIRGSVHLLGDGEPFQDLNGNGIWDPGEPFQDLNGNGVYDGPLAMTDLSSSFSGNSHVGNNYNGLPSNLQDAIPSLELVNGLETLNAEMRVKNGQVRLQGNATVGSPYNVGIGQGTLDGTYVTHGWTGSGGANSVFSDNGTNQVYDLGNRVSFPFISGIGAQQYSHGGLDYSNHAAYLNSNSLTIDLNTIDNSTAAISVGPDAHGNSFQWIPPSGGQDGTIVVNGIVRINGSLSLNEKHNTIRYQGRGTLFATEDIHVRGNILPVSGQIFPTQTALGLIANRDMFLATGAGEAQLSMVGAFYAQRRIVSSKQNQIAGTFVSSYFDMGTNVPSIYQVPALASNLPPGMPGGDAIISMQRRTWRERGVMGGPNTVVID